MTHAQTVQRCYATPQLTHLVICNYAGPVSVGFKQLVAQVLHVQLGLVQLGLHTLSVPQTDQEPQYQYNNTGGGEGMPLGGKP
jgi:hypothetical protein